MRPRPYPFHSTSTSSSLARTPGFGAKSAREIYERVNDKGGKYSVPIFWDKKSTTIVSNESSEIIRFLNSEFNDLEGVNDLDLYPLALRPEIDRINDMIYEPFNNGVYKCGFAKSQTAYNNAITDLTECFDKIEAQLSDGRKFLCGDELTEADVRLFPTMARFDEVYIVYFKTNTRSVLNNPTMREYCRRVCAVPGIKDTINMDHIKAHYYCSHPSLNQHSIISRGAGFMEAME
jgi:putative glutathione S-transferase